MIRILILYTINIYPALFTKCGLYLVLNLEDLIFICSFVGDEYAGHNDYISSKL